MIVNTDGPLLNTIQTIDAMQDAQINVLNNVADDLNAKHSQLTNELIHAKNDITEIREHTVSVERRYVILKANNDELTTRVDDLTTTVEEQKDITRQLTIIIYVSYMALITGVVALSFVF